MKPINDIRISFDLRSHEIDFQLKYFRKLDIDLDVFLPTRGKNLQRPLVWSIDQKRELIWSVLMRRPIPPVSIINSISKEDDRKDVYLVIDGKQRISTMLEFIDGKFTLDTEDGPLTFSQLPEDYQSAILHHSIRVNIINEPWDDRITDDQKVEWFMFINFAGTRQDKAHMEALKNKI